MATLVVSWLVFAIDRDFDGRRSGAELGNDNIAAIGIGHPPGGDGRAHEQPCNKQKPCIG